jgi:hypothetical protein
MFVDGRLPRETCILRANVTRTSDNGRRYVGPHTLDPLA